MSYTYFHFICLYSMFKFFSFFFFSFFYIYNFSDFQDLLDVWIFFTNLWDFFCWICKIWFLIYLCCTLMIFFLWIYFFFHLTFNFLGLFLKLPGILLNTIKMTHTNGLQTLFLPEGQNKPWPRTKALSRNWKLACLAGRTFWIIAFARKELNLRIMEQDFVCVLLSAAVSLPGIVCPISVAPCSCRLYGLENSSGTGKIYLANYQKVKYLVCVWWQKDWDKKSRDHKDVP